jgi:hypothetical protein
MKFIVDSENKTILILEKISFKEIEKMKVWLGVDWENWTVDAKERVIEKDNWQPFIPNPPFQPFPIDPFPNPPPYPIAPTPYIPYYPTICYHIDNESQLMIECNSIKELSSYDAMIHQVNYVMRKK